MFASSAIPGFTLKRSALTQQATGQLVRANSNSLKTTLLPNDLKEPYLIDPVNAQLELSTAPNMICFIQTSVPHFVHVARTEEHKYR